MDLRLVIFILVLSAAVQMSISLSFYFRYHRPQAVSGWQYRIGRSSKSSKQLIRLNLTKTQICLWKGTQFKCNGSMQQ